MLLIGCPLFTNTVVFLGRQGKQSSYHALCSVSLSTLTAISVDRLLALLLGLRYKEIVTLRRGYIILAIVWAVCLVAGMCSYLNYRIAIRCSFISTSSCLIVLVASYTKIFRALSHHQESQPNALSMVRYRKALHSAVWVHLALIVCYVPYFTLIILCEVRCPNDIRIEGMAIVLVFFNSSLNPFLYCWKIIEVRQAVKQIIRQAISCAQVDLISRWLFLLKLIWKIIFVRREGKICHFMIKKIEENLKNYF